jgi:outer membrane protein
VKLKTSRDVLIVTTIAAALLGAGAAHAQKNDLLSVYRDALSNDSVFAAARFANQAAQERTPQARSALLPNINAGVDLTQTYYRSDTPDISRDWRSWGPAITLTMPLYRPGNWDAVDQAKLAVISADAVLAQSRQDLVLRVTQAYFDVLAATDALTAIEASKKATAEQLAQARREFEVGTKTIVDTHEAQARYDQIVAAEQVARGDLIIRSNALRSIIGREAGNLLPLRDAPELLAPQPASMDSWAKQAEESSFSVAVARATSDIARIEVERARHGHYPTLDLVASVSQDRSNGSVSSTTTNTTRSGAIGLQLNVPLYTGGLTQSRVREALANDERARQDLESARRNAAQSARQAYTGVDFGLAQVRALESAEVSSRSQLDSTRLGYQVGVRINLDVLNAQTQLFNTQRDLKRARYDFLINGLRLKSAVGNLSEKDLEAINALLAR